MKQMTASQWQMMEQDSLYFLNIFQVSIPSIFISLKDYELLAKEVSKTAVEESNDSKVFALMKFDVNKSDNVSVIIALNVQD